MSHTWTADSCSFLQASNVFSNVLCHSKHSFKKTVGWTLGKYSEILRISLRKTDLHNGNKVSPSHTAKLTSNKGLLLEKQVCKGHEQTALEAAVTNCSCEGHLAHGIHDSDMLRTGTITFALYAFCGRWQAGLMHVWYETQADRQWKPMRTGLYPWK